MTLCSISGVENGWIKVLGWDQSKEYFTSFFLSFFFWYPFTIKLIIILLRQIYRFVPYVNLQLKRIWLKNFTKYTFWNWRNWTTASRLLIYSTFLFSFSRYAMEMLKILTVGITCTLQLQQILGGNISLLVPPPDYSFNLILIHSHCILCRATRVVCLFFSFKCKFLATIQPINCIMWVLIAVIYLWQSSFQQTPGNWDKHCLAQIL